MEGIDFQSQPLDFLLILARYKFAARMIRPGDSVADVGCGSASGSVLLSQFSDAVTAFDFDEDILAANRKQYGSLPNLKFKSLDLLEPSKLSESFDIVVSMDVIEHFPESQLSKVGESYRRLTAPGGLAVIGTPNRASRIYASKRRLAIHPHEFEPEEYENFLRQYYDRVLLFSMTDETISMSFNKLAWYLIAVCFKSK